MIKVFNDLVITLRVNYAIVNGNDWGVIFGLGNWVLWDSYVPRGSVSVFAMQ